MDQSGLGSQSGRKAAIAAAFDHAAHSYDHHATLQRLVAARLAARIAALRLPERPRILEIGCGTGFLTQALRQHFPTADWVVTDVSARMLARCRAGLGEPADVVFAVMDGEVLDPAIIPAIVGRGFDLICSSLAVQWFGDLPAALQRWSALLAPGGHMAFATPMAGSLQEWCDAHVAAGLTHGVLPFADRPALVAGWPRGGNGWVEQETIVRHHPDGKAFLGELRGLGAYVPAAGRTPLGAGALRRLLRQFAAPVGIAVTWKIAYATFRRFPASGRPGVFVSGTDTDVGKTCVSAALTRAWGADYWKVVQTGVPEYPADSATVATLAGVDGGRILPPAAVFAAPLAPLGAAAAEGRRFTLDDVPPLPACVRPIVAEGAGGLLVPLSDGTFMTDVAARLGLPVVLVARSGLGTLNHTLLSLEALRRRHLPIAGVIMVGPLNPGNAAAIADLGQVRVLAQIPWLETLDAAAVARVATENIPPLSSVLP